MHVQLGGKRWELVFRKLSDCRGACDDPNKVGKKIQIDSDLSGEEELEVLIHEMLHAGNWLHRSEESVTREADEMSRVLWRLGYRREMKDGDRK